MTRGMTGTCLSEPNPCSISCDGACNVSVQAGSGSDAQPGRVGNRYG
eukprot:CAMPEP_0201723822 /NCGR_PEP_ID=MMETSP0593-20130828/7723_1 /ASSEMBLY_ACC=CAM_ASM_000672 /TAXON_ID=267983 /ORGANISM="Skeletonema japonicum, Strain CCMP2506" /LENGTH=46 /DNA_ID= /DNA_START= /DNA_END= /DNA_ORIENTATION=